MTGSMAWWLYDWAGLNRAALMSLQADTAAVDIGAWTISAVASYWSAPVVAALLAWRAESSASGHRAALFARQYRCFLVAGLFAVAATWLMKDLFSLPRPFEIMELSAPAIARQSSTASLPSGHSVYAALLVTTLWPLTGTVGRVATVVLAAAVGWSRVAQGLHFPADVVWGWVTGLACAGLAFWVLSTSLARWFGRSAGALAHLIAEQLLNLVSQSQYAPRVRQRPAEPPSRLRFAWWALAFAIAGIDLLIKSAIHGGLPYGVSIPVTAFFNVVHHWNTGAAFGMLADAGGWQRYFLAALAAAVSLILLGALLTRLHRLEALAFAFITGGALGNGIERVLRGHVVDYLDFHWSGAHWPAFNLADVSLSAAVVLIALTWYRPYWSQRPSEAGR